MTTGTLDPASKSHLPDFNSAATVPGLSGKVDLRRDTWGIPHVRAASHLDAFAGLGFAHAQELPSRSTSQAPIRAARRAWRVQTTAISKAARYRANDQTRRPPSRGQFAPCSHSPLCWKVACAQYVHREIKENREKARCSWRLGRAASDARDIGVDLLGNSGRISVQGTARLPDLAQERLGQP